MQQKVLRAIKDYDMLKNCTEITVALSGGADSVALLHCLLSLKGELGVKIYALHLNHLLRGEESNRDEAFVKGLCEKLGVELTVQRTDIMKESKVSGESIELAARRVRYAFFEKARHGAVATAHTASDSAETVLFNLTRGTAAAGLCGIPPVREGFVRPLIYCTRQDVEAYCAQNGIEFVNDSTNFTDEYTRNKIRHNAVPVLREINPSFENSVMRMSAAIREDNAFLEEVARTEYNNALIENGLDVNKINKLHPAVVKRVLRCFFYEQFNAELDSVNLNLLQQTVKGKIGATVLPSGVTASVKNGCLMLSKGTEKPKFHYKTEIKEENIQKINNLLLKNVLDCGKIVGELTIRTRLTGDKIRIADRGVTKSLKKLFCEMKIPENERDLIPVVSDQKGVVWVHTVGVSERVKCTSKTEKALIINSEKILG